MMTLLLLLAAVGQADRAAVDAPEAKPAPCDCPFAAHNAYPHRGEGAERLEQALKAGLRFIEIDITYDNSRQTAVVTHDARARGNEPRLAEFWRPLWSAWLAAPPAERVLILDAKTADVRLAHELVALLAPYAPHVSWAEKKAPETFHTGRVTVCLTGDDAIKRAYAASVAVDGKYLAFADRVYSAGAWKEHVADYVPAEPPGFLRFLTFHYQNFMPGPRSGAESDPAPERARRLVEVARRRGYRVRVYTLNALSKLREPDTRFWELCVDAGVPMIATDDYGFAAKWWRERVQPGQPRAP